MRSTQMPSKAAHSPPDWQIFILLVCLLHNINVATIHRKGIQPNHACSIILLWLKRW